MEIDDGSCVYPELGYDCDGGCIAGFAPLTLSWDNADSNTSFTIISQNFGELFSYDINNFDGSETQCWSTSLEKMIVLLYQ